VNEIICGQKEFGTSWITKCLDCSTAVTNILLTFSVPFTYPPFIEQKAIVGHEIFRVFFCPITIGVSITWRPTNLFHVPRLASRTYQYNSGTSSFARGAHVVTSLNECGGAVCSIWHYMKLSPVNTALFTDKNKFVFRIRRYMFRLIIKPSSAIPHKNMWVLRHLTLFSLSVVTRYHTVQLCTCLKRFNIAYFQ
jgi:hypothetical protein